MAATFFFLGTSRTSSDDTHRWRTLQVRLDSFNRLVSPSSHLQTNNLTIVGGWAISKSSDVPMLILGFNVMSICAKHKLQKIYIFRVRFVLAISAVASSKACRVMQPRFAIVDEAPQMRKVEAVGQ